MFERIFNFQTKTVAFGVLILATSTLISGILGLFRDRLLAANFGVASEVDIYAAAFKIPDLITGILVLGGISAAFLPVFSEYFAKDEKGAWKVANNILNCFLILLILISLILAIFSPFLISLVAPGFSTENKSQTITLTRIMFLSPILFGLSYIFSGILHYFNRFLIYSIAPILYNLGIIFGILFFYPLFGLKGLAVGVIFGALLHWLIQIPTAKNLGFRYSLYFNFKSEEFKKIFKLMTPRAIGAFAYYLSLLIINAIASTLPTGSISVFYYSNNLQTLPAGIIGLSFATVSFPILAKSWVNNQKLHFKQSFSSIFRQILFLAIPISFLIFILRAHLVRLILGTGELGWLGTRLISASLGIFGFGIFAITFIPFLWRAFFSFQDTKTPVLIEVFSILISLTLAIFFVEILKSPNFFESSLRDFLKLKDIKEISILGLPLALTISNLIQFFLLTYFLFKKIGDFGQKEIFTSLRKILIASFFMVFFVYLILYQTEPFLNTRTYFGLFLQTLAGVITGILVYFLAGLLLKSQEIKNLFSSLLKEFSKNE